MNEFELINSTEYFDQIRNYKNIILFGCGGKGRQAIKILNDLGVRVSVACDNNSELHGKLFVNNILIKSLDEILKDIEINDTCIIITCSIDYAVEINNMLMEKCPNISIYHMCNPFKIEQILLSSQDIISNWDLLARQYDWLGDEESKNIFIDTLNSKITGNMLPLLKYTLGKDIYTFFDDEFITVDENSVYMDVGAYTGDTVASFLMFSRGIYKQIVAFEADKGNYASLQKFKQFSRVPNIDIYNIGLWNNEEDKLFYTNDKNDEINYDSPNLFQNVNMMADNLSLNRINGNLIDEVIHLKTLDGIAQDMSPNIIKVNALAADRQIIMGGKKYIAEKKPTLIFEFGVKKKDVFELLIDIKKINPDYTFFIRRKKIFGDIKTVVYCT